MSGAGLRMEADAVDEQLFANWLGNLLDQVRGALQGGYVRDALNHAGQLRDVLDHAGEASPLMALFSRTLAVLEEQIEENVRYREGLLQQTLTRVEVRRQVYERTNAALQASPVSASDELQNLLQAAESGRRGG
jgi:hypothetical protein